MPRKFSGAILALFGALLVVLWELHTLHEALAKLISGAFAVVTVCLAPVLDHAGVGRTDVFPSVFRIVILCAASVLLPQREVKEDVFDFRLASWQREGFGDGS